MALFRKSSCPPPPSPASDSREQISHIQLALCRPTHVKCVVTARWEGGVAWVALCGLSTKQGNTVFWWFLRSYLTTSHSSYWYFLLLKQRIFLCYLCFQVMAILCCVAKNSLRGTMCMLIIINWVLYIKCSIFTMWKQYISQWGVAVLVSIHFPPSFRCHSCRFRFISFRFCFVSP